LIVLLSTAFLAAGAQVALAQLDSATQSLGATGAESTTGAQTTATCPKPRLTGLPKRPKQTNTTVHFKLVNMTKDAAYLIKAGVGEVFGGAATSGTVENSFQLPDQGAKSGPVTITAIVSTDACTNSPWKLQKKIQYKGYKVAATPTPTPPAATPTPTPAPAVTAPKVGKTPAITPPKLPKLPKPLSQRLPTAGQPLSVRTYMTPIDNAARLVTAMPQPRLARLERRADKANSSNALVGLAILFVLFTIGTAVGLWVFHRRDEIQFEAALSAQLKHLEEGDPGLSHEEPSTAPFSAQVAESGLAEATTEVPTEVAPVPVPAVASNGATEEPPVTHHRSEVEAQLHGILNEGGFEAELHDILADAKSEAERQGVEIDPDLMLQALSEELGAAQLSDVAREELRSKFERIIADEVAHVPQQAT
jgi:hypothetical protein